MVEQEHRLGYVKIPNFHEVRELPTCGSWFVVEEKVDGKTFDGSSACVEVWGVELCVFGEYVGVTHLIFYKDLMSYVFVFDVRLNGMYLKPLPKVLISTLLGIPHAPIKGFIREVTEEVVTQYYIEEKSYFKTDLNPVVCKKHPQICQNFKELYGENFSEGIVVKCYEDGKIKAVKYVKPEFDKIINEIGRYENYPNTNIVKFNIDTAAKLQKTNLEKVIKNNASQTHIQNLLKLFIEAYENTYSSKTIEEAVKTLPGRNKDMLKIAIERCVSNLEAC
ncbi:MAG: hypothetical protein B7O98_08895 [Zestosphaera tikiterensis]|uniref:RNA ligase domain-containing protein n=1 Tax=Zestosphaera tikiterensis TaxID=1973259 RepID=A0A2R7Y2W2_9CREN|nr:MAG: hypothetical protein B7O98_08725 [Zestosphaera tikiterensis]PUA31730.1 MAG: hypothetical protein B7O98_08895 [Zestosphaera tikiterensis]